MGEWISVNDRMPEPYREVLVEVDGHRRPNWRNNYNLVAYIADSGQWWEERHNIEEIIGVTHWIELPEPPEVE